MKNRCYRGAPCLHGTPVAVGRGDDWDYYDKRTRSYIYLECRLHQKHYSPSLLEIEETEKYQSGMGSATYETPDLQLADTNGKWFTNSDNPDNYQWLATDAPQTCNLCDILCEVRDDHRYLLADGSCPYPSPAPTLKYLQVRDNDQPCNDYLHPFLLQDIKAINRKRARMTKIRLGQYLKEKKWRDLLITKKERIIDVWKRNYKPVTFYYNSFESIWLYIKNLPPEMKENTHLRQRIRENIELSPSYQTCIEKGEWEKRMLYHIEGNDRDLAGYRI